MRNRSLIICALFWTALTGAVEDDHTLSNYYYQLLHQRSATPNVRTVKVEPPQKEENKRIRSHQEGILDIEATTITPIRVNVSAGVAQVVGNIELTTRRETNARWFFRAENVPEDQNIWDADGRAVLVPGKVSCQISHRASITDYKQAGLTLTAGGNFSGVGVSYSNGVSTERVRSDFVEGEDICDLGEVAALTTQKEIEQKCKACLGRVLKTIKQDVQGRLARLNYVINTPICSRDSECYREDTDWYAGRCVLVKDKNESYFSECRARGSIGSACPGKGSRGLFEFKCDKGLACVQVYSATGWTDHNKYECRDPFNKRFAGPLLPRDRAAYWTAKSDLEKIKEALEKYHQIHKKYPTTEVGLKALTSGNLPRDPFSEFGDRGYLYASLDGKGYIATSVGPDGKVGTNDDIVIRK